MEWLRSNYGNDQYQFFASVGKSGKILTLFSVFQKKFGHKAKKFVLNLLLIFIEINFCAITRLIVSHR